MVNTPRTDWVIVVSMSRARRRWLIVIGVVLVSIAVLGAVLYRSSQPGDTFVPPLPAERSDSGQQLQEDDPGWDCRTMGNRQCGPVDTAVVV